MRGERAWGDGSASGVRGDGLTQGWGPRARAERTRNIWNMPETVPLPGKKTYRGKSMLTLDVSKLSGWLNANACCRVEKRAYGAGRGASQKAGGRGAAQVACKGEAPTQGWGPRARAERT